MRRVRAFLFVVAVLGACTSGAAPGAEQVLEQTEKAKQLGEQVDERNSQFGTTP